MADSIVLEKAIQDSNLMDIINLLKGVGTKDEYSFGQEYFGSMAGTSRRQILQKLTGHFGNTDALKRKPATS